MPRPLSVAMAQAYATAPRNRVIFHTVELMHASFPAPQRFVTGRETDLTATLEATAPFNPNTAVVFTALAFDFIPPGHDESGPSPARIRLDGVSGQLVAILDLTLSTNAPINVIYRAFVDNALTSPGDVITGLKLRNVTLDAQAAEGELTFDDVATRAFPRGVYDKARFPALFVA